MSATDLGAQPPAPSRSSNFRPAGRAVQRGGRDDQDGYCPSRIRQCMVLDLIVRSLLDTDFYKLLMLQMIWEAQTGRRCHLFADQPHEDRAPRRRDRRAGTGARPAGFRPHAALHQEKEMRDPRLVKQQVSTAAGGSTLPRPSPRPRPGRVQFRRGEHHPARGWLEGRTWMLTFRGAINEPSIWEIRHLPSTNRKVQRN